jgi:hypothetical protein
LLPRQVTASGQFFPDRLLIVGEPFPKWAAELVVALEAAEPVLGWFSQGVFVVPESEDAGTDWSGAVLL